MKTLTRLASALMLLIMASSVHALDLDTAKAQKLVGETDTGYLAAVGAANDAVNQLVAEINAKRRQYYEDLAKKNNVALPEVEKLAGKKSISKTASGLMVQIGGSWAEK